MQAYTFGTNDISWPRHLNNAEEKTCVAIVETKFSVAFHKQNPSPISM